MSADAHLEKAEECQSLVYDSMGIIKLCPIKNPSDSTIGVSVELMKTMGALAQSHALIATALLMKEARV